jgi:hypothetical protein
MVRVESRVIERKGDSGMSGNIQTSLMFPLGSFIFSARFERLAILGCMEGTAFAAAKANRVARVMVVKCIVIVMLA